MGRTRKPDIDASDERLERLKEQLFNARIALLGSLPRQLRDFLLAQENEKNVIAWRYRAIRALVERAQSEWVPANEAQKAYPEFYMRTLCPLCHDRPQQEPEGWKIPAGLERHLEKCDVMWQLFYLFKDHFYLVSSKVEMGLA